jgi:hypothetical protein
MTGDRIRDVTTTIMNGVIVFLQEHKPSGDGAANRDSGRDRGKSA